jgi:hypothetical protein
VETRDIELLACGVGLLGAERPAHVVLYAMCHRLGLALENLWEQRPGGGFILYSVPPFVSNVGAPRLDAGSGRPALGALRRPAFAALEDASFRRGPVRVGTTVRPIKAVQIPLVCRMLNQALDGQLHGTDSRCAWHFVGCHHGRATSPHLSNRAESPRSRGLLVGAVEVSSWPALGALTTERGEDWMHVLFATPTAGGIVKSVYAATLFKAVRAVKDAGWKADFATFDGSCIAAARNYFANTLVRQPHFTHLVMVDSDMSFEGHIVCRLLRSDKPVAAGAYSKRRMDMGAFAEAARNPKLAPTDLAALALEYNLAVELEPGTRQVKVIDGMCRVDRIALGCAAIRREAFERLIAGKMVQLRPDRLLQRTDLKGPIYDFFGEITLEDGDRLSEDYSFCRRWRSVVGNEIWALVDESIGHVGDMVYGAPYVNRLLQGKA